MIISPSPKEASRLYKHTLERLFIAEDYLESLMVSSKLFLSPEQRKNINHCIVRVHKSIDQIRKELLHYDARRNCNHNDQTIQS